MHGAAWANIAIGTHKQYTSHKVASRVSVMKVAWLGSTQMLTRAIAPPLALA